MYNIYNKEDMVTYSIINEKWIPVKYTSSENVEYISLKTLFNDAHIIDSISDENDMTNLGILRLACVFLMDMAKMENVDDRKNLLKKSSFDMSVFNEYINACEKHGNCFDLFDINFPFLQTPNMNDGEKFVSNISDFACSGTETLFFGGKYESLYAFTPAQCARSLCQKMTTVIKDGGSGYHTFFPIKNAIFMLCKGKNLYETIVLNSISKNEWISQGTIYNYGTEKEKGMKGPFWMQTPSVSGEKVDIELSLLAMMTFMPVNINLILDDDGLVRRVYYTGKILQQKVLLQKKTC